jgi:Zinc carboxypeptidase
MPRWFDAQSRTFALGLIVLCAAARAQPTAPVEAPVANPASAADKVYVLPDGYPSAERVRAILEEAAQANPDLCRAVDLTQSYNTPPTHEGRHLYALRVSAGAPDQDKPAVLFVAAHHGDEVASVVTALAGIDLLVAGYGTDPTISTLLDTREVWIAPLWNPDGYARGARTNGRPNDNNTVGVDLNRNYPVGFGTCGGSDVPGAATYKGTAAASEPETQTMLAFARDKRFVIVHDAHAGAFDLRTGYGCDKVHPWRESMNRQAASMIETTQLNFSQGSSCCLAGNIHTHMATSLATAFLWELGDKEQPIGEAREQADAIWGSIIANLAQPISLTGHTTDASTGKPVAATITLPDAGFTMNESGTTRGEHARFDLILPAGVHTIVFSAEGYEPTRIEIAVEPGTALVREIALVPVLDTPTTADPR